MFPQQEFIFSLLDPHSHPLMHHLPSAANQNPVFKLQHSFINTDGARDGVLDIFLKPDQVSDTQIPRNIEHGVLADSVYKGVLVSHWLLWADGARCASTHNHIPQRNIVITHQC